MSVTVYIISAPSGDWEGLYVDGHLMAEGHQITPTDVCDALGIDLITEEAHGDTLDYINKHGRMPTEA